MLEVLPTASVAPILNLAFYRFTRLPKALPELRIELKTRALELGLKGTVLLSPEGINGFVAGAPDAARAFVQFVRDVCQLPDLDCKESVSPKVPFRRMLVRLKREIITLGIDAIDPTVLTGTNLAPATLKEWLDAGKPVTLIDTRNTYELELGTFNNAVDLKLRSFREFPEKLAQAAVANPSLKDQPVVMFCTGGIRCEKATAVGIKQGFKEVYQLEGGILRYFERVGGAHWKGDCFVFDNRVSLKPDLTPGDAVLCFECRSVSARGAGLCQHEKKNSGHDRNVSNIENPGAQLA